jgi:uncharacterized membrane protein
MAQVIAVKRFTPTLVAAAASAWAVLLVTGPWVTRSSESLGGVLYLAAGLVCHQLPERSFHFGGSQLPVCARCLGLYLGGAAGLMIWAVAASARTLSLRRASALRWLALAAVPTAVSVVSAWIGTGDPDNIWRALLAAPLGFAAGAVVGAVTTEHLK